MHNLPVTVLDGAEADAEHSVAGEDAGTGEEPAKLPAREAQLRPAKPPITQ